MGRPSLKVKSCLFNDRRLVEPFQVRPETTPVIFILRIIQYVVDHERVKQPPPEELEGFMNLHQDSVNAFSFKELNRPLKSLLRYISSWTQFVGFVDAGAASSINARIG